MLNNEEMSALVQPIINIYNQMELDLIVDIAKRFDKYDEIGGSLEWQLKKLDELGTLNADAVKTIARFSEKSQSEIVEMLKKSTFANIDFDGLKNAYNAGAIVVDPVTLNDDVIFSQLINDTFKELNGTFRMIQTKALESAKQAYMTVINRAYIETATGTYSYNEAIKNAIKRMVDDGITAATYRRGGKLVNYSIEAAVRRDTTTATHKLANKASETVCAELEAEYVEISAHLGARVHPTNPIANHAGWQGKVFKVNGSDAKYPNLKESTGYPDDILGLGGVNCRHRMFPFFPGISTPNPINFNEAENAKVYKLTQYQRKLERDMRRLKKQQAAAAAYGADEEAEKYGDKIRAKSAELTAFCKANGLRRDYSRELVAEQIK